MPANPEKSSLFALTLTYIKPLEEVDRLIEPHRAYLRHHYELGNFLVSGAQKPRTGGFILARADSKAQIESIIANDPFLSEGVARYDIVEFQPSSFAPGLEQLLP
jgi:uncharacterized protein YciI